MIMAPRATKTEAYVPPNVPTRRRTTTKHPGRGAAAAAASPPSHGRDALLPPPDAAPPDPCEGFLRKLAVCRRRRTPARHPRHPGGAAASSTRAVEGEGAGGGEDDAHPVAEPGGATWPPFCEELPLSAYSIPAEFEDPPGAWPPFRETLPLSAYRIPGEIRMEDQPGAAFCVGDLAEFLKLDGLERKCPPGVGGDGSRPATTM